MSKIICDVCGTRYPDSSNQCPICGCIRNAEQMAVETDVSEEELTTASRSSVRGGRFSKSNVRKRNKNQPVYEEAETPAPAPAPEADEEAYDSYEEFEGGSRRKRNVFLNLLLVLVIVALLLVSAYVFLKYVMPNTLDGILNRNPTEATEMTDVPTEATQPATEAQQTEAARIPCEQLILDVTDITLTEAGQMYLLNVQTLPEDTTDTIMYISSNEDVATVNEEGRVTAVGEGSVVISIFCGEQQTECNVICAFATEAPTEVATEAPVEGETQAPAEGETEAPAEGETEAPAEGETEAPTEGPTEPLKDVELKVKTSDMTFRARGQQAVIKLLCKLTNQEVTWTSANESVATVDQDGVITRIGAGTTIITGQYGDQKVEIIVRCPKG